MTTAIASTFTLELREELTGLFEKLDSESKLMASLVGLSQCVFGTRRFFDLGQLRDSAAYFMTDEAAETAERINPDVVPHVNEIRRHLESVAADPPDYQTAEFVPTVDSSTREFQWGDTFSEPVWFDIRHAARKALVGLESVLSPRPGPPPGADGPPA
ncbi:MAG TPA: hypothetical protein VNT22_00060 [Baekduia sp.]|nr:hypothetical protein [Baekduia sp.]